MAVVDGSKAGEESLVMEWDEPQQLLVGALLEVLLVSNTIG